MALLTGWAGTYAGPQGGFLWQFALDGESGRLQDAAPLHAAGDCKYVSFAGGVLAYPLRRGPRAGLAARALPGGGAAALFCEREAACFVTQDEQFIYTANYHEGSILIYRRESSAGRFCGLTLVRRLETGAGSGCHQVLLQGRFLLASCLLRDEVLIFDRENDFAPLPGLRFAAGTGPRHGVFDRAGGHLYLVSELSNELFCFRVRGAQLTLAQKLPLLDAGTPCTAPPSAAAVRLSADGRFLYVSVRFADVLCVFEVAGDGAVKRQQTGCGGIHPRDLALAPGGRFVLAANRTDGSLVCFARDARTGRIGPECSRAAVPQAVSIAFSAPDDSILSVKG